MARHQKILVSLLVMLFMSAANGLSQETIRITTGEYAPFLSENLKYKGLWARICTEAFALSGLHVEYHFFPWKRAYILAERGQWDATLGWFHSDKREQAFYFSEPVGLADYVFFHLKAKPFEWNILNDLKGLKIGCTLEYTYPKDFLEAGKKGDFTLDFVSSDVLNFRKLIGNRNDIFPVDRNVGYYLLKTRFTPEQAGKLTHHPKQLTENLAYLIFPRKLERSQKTVDVFNKGIQQLKADGKLEQYEKESQQGEYIPK